MSFFDAPWHVIVLLVVVLLLFGSKRLPGAAKSLGQSMHIFKKSVKGMTDDDDDLTAGPPPPAAALQNPPQSQPADAPRSEDATQEQIKEMQRQLDELQRQSASGAAHSDAPHDHQAS